ncbi:MAG: lipid II:glycine glycyltransferase FemX, partial [Thermodesulfobacteriota bacterium]
MELKLFESPGQLWDEFATRYTDLIFYQSIWSRVLKEGLGGQPLYFYLDENGEIITGLPAILLNFKVFKILYASIPFGNLIGEKESFHPFMELLEREFKRLRIDQVRVVESPFLEPYPLNSYQSILSKWTILDLKRFNRNEIWGSYKEKVRRAIRKAKRNGLVVRTLTSPTEVDIFYYLYLSSMERKRAFAKYPRRWFQIIYEFLIKEGKADILFALKSDQFTAGVVVIYSPDSLHYFHNGSDRAFLEYRPNDLIVDYMIQKGVEEEKAVLDFMGSDPDDTSLIRFKEKWGG